MASLLQSLVHLFKPSNTPAHDLDDRYLAQATDIYDLERRMRQLDAGHRELVGAYGIFMR